MGRRCAWGLCKSDERYPNRLDGAFFLPFPKPHSQLEKCLRWIQACGRPFYQLNVNRIDKNKYVCSKVRRAFLSHIHTHTLASNSFETRNRVMELIS